MPCCSFENAVDRQFGEKNARRQLRRYHRRGIGGTASMLLEGLAKARLTEGTVLDVGAGIGSLTFELLEQGARSAVVVEASAAYADVVASEAARRGAHQRCGWYMRATMVLANVLMRTKSGFRTFVHPEGDVRRLVEQAVEV